MNNVGDDEGKDEKVSTFLPPLGFLRDVCKNKMAAREIMDWALREIRLD